MDPYQGWVICIGINGHPFTKTSRKKRKEEGYIIDPSDLQFLSEYGIPAYTNTHSICRSQALASVIVYKSSFEASHKVNTSHLLGC